MITKSMTNIGKIWVVGPVLNVRSVKQDEISVFATKTKRMMPLTNKLALNAGTTTAGACEV